MPHRREQLPAPTGRHRTAALRPHVNYLRQGEIGSRLTEVRGRVLSPERQVPKCPTAGRSGAEGPSAHAVIQPLVHSETVRFRALAGL